MKSLVFLFFAAWVACLAAGAFEVNGHVRDGEGAPVPAAKVWIKQGARVTSAESDSNGAFAFGDVAVGPMELVAYKDGFALGGVSAVAVATGAVDVTLAKAGTLEMRLIERHSGPSGELPSTPVAGARLKALLVNDSFFVAVDELSDHGFPSFRSGDDGLLQIPCLPDGGFASFTVSHRNYTDAQVSYYPVGDRQLTLPMVQGVVVRGRVADEAGAGISDASAVVFVSTNEVLQEVFHGPTGPEGYFTARLRPGRYLVAAKHPSYATPVPIPLIVTENDEDIEGDVILPAAHPVEGHTVYADGKPAAGVHVGYVRDGQLLDSTYSDENGAFRIMAEEGECLVRLTPPAGFVVKPSPIVPVTIEGDRFDFQEALVLQPLPTVEGTVLMADGKPAAQAIVVSTNLTDPVSALADAEGHFTVQLKTMPEDATAQFSAEHPLRFERGTFSVNLTAPEPVSAALTAFEPNLAECDTANSPNNLGRLLGEAAPAIDCNAWFIDGTLSTEDGPTLASLKGKVVVMTFWGGFDESGPGRNRLREMNLLYDAYAAESDVAIIGIHDSGNENDEIAGFIRKYGIRFPVGRDNETKTFNAYDILVIPQTVIIDKKGVLRFFDVNGRLIELIKALRREAG